MSSSDYIALKKLKEIKGSCDADDLGNPLSPSWYNVPVNDNCDCTVTLGTGPTGPIGMTGYTGYTGHTGYTGPVGPTQGGVFSIFAETTTFDASSNNGHVFSFGSRQDNSGNYGVII